MIPIITWHASERFETAMLGDVPVGRVFYAKRPTYMTYLSSGGLPLCIMSGPVKNIEIAKAAVTENTLSWLRAAGLIAEIFPPDQAAAPVGKVGI